MITLRLCDANKPAMCKLLYFAHRTTESITKSVDDLNDESIFGSLGDTDDDVSYEKSQVFDSSEGGGNAVNGEMYDR